MNHLLCVEALKEVCGRDKIAREVVFCLWGLPTQQPRNSGVLSEQPGLLAARLVWKG